MVSNVQASHLASSGSTFTGIAGSACGPTMTPVLVQGI